MTLYQHESALLTHDWEQRGSHPKSICYWNPLVIVGMIPGKKRFAPHKTLVSHAHAIPLPNIWGYLSDSVNPKKNTWLESQILHQFHDGFPSFFGTKHAKKQKLWPLSHPLCHNEWLRAVEISGYLWNSAGSQASLRNRLGWSRLVNHGGSEWPVSPGVITCYEKIWPIGMGHYYLLCITIIFVDMFTLCYLLFIYGLRIICHQCKTWIISSRQSCCVYKTWDHRLAYHGTIIPKQGGKSCMVGMLIFLSFFSVWLRVLRERL